MITPKSQSLAHEKEGGVHLLNIIHDVAVKAARKLPNGLYGETRNSAGEKRWNNFKYRTKPGDLGKRETYEKMVC